MTHCIMPHDYYSTLHYGCQGTFGPNTERSHSDLIYNSTTTLDLDGLQALYYNEII